MLRGSGDGRVMDIDRLRVLVVEDEPLIMTEIALLLEEAGYRVDTASSVQGALSRLAQTRFDAVVLDVELREAIAGDVAEALVCGPDPKRHLEQIRKFANAGFDHVYVHQVGPDQEGFLQFYEQEIISKIASLSRSASTSSGK